MVEAAAARRLARSGPCDDRDTDRDPSRRCIDDLDVLGGREPPRFCAEARSLRGPKRCRATVNGWGGTAGSVARSESELLRDDDLEQIAEIERGPTKCSPLTLWRSCRPAEQSRSLRAAAVVLVAGRPAVGFARVDVVDGLAHLEQPERPAEDTRMGIGRRARRGRLPVGGRSAASGRRHSADHGSQTSVERAVLRRPGGFREIDEPHPGLRPSCVTGNATSAWTASAGARRMRRDLGAPPHRELAGREVTES